MADGLGHYFESYGPNKSGVLAFQQNVDIELRISAIVLKRQVSDNISIKFLLFGISYFILQHMVADVKFFKSVSCRKPKKNTLAFSSIVLRKY